MYQHENKNNQGPLPAVEDKVSFAASGIDEQLVQMKRELHISSPFIFFLFQGINVYVLSKEAEKTRALVISRLELGLC